MLAQVKSVVAQVASAMRGLNDTSLPSPEITNVEVDAMLEIAPKYCTRIRHCESMKSVVPDTQPPTVREDVPISSAARVFLLHNLLTPSECAHYIRETESLVYRDLSDEFDCDYRSNQRILVLSEKLADHLYSRMQLQLNRHDCLRVRPMCFGNSGTWKPVRLNECFKFGKYQQKQHFGTHIDGPWVPRTDESSIYTVLIYLNDDFTGGRTVFIPDEQRLQMDAKITEMRRTQCEEYDQIIGGGGGDGGATGSGGVSATMTNAATTTTSSSFTAGYTTNAADGIVTIQPRCGTALLFTHDTLHAGLPVMTGCKYVMRTELMFHRVDSEMIPPSIRNSYEEDPAYQRTLKLYRQSYEKNQQGDVEGFTNSYLEALKLQHQAQLSIAADTRAIHQLNLPIALYIHTFTFLTTEELAHVFCVNQSWKDLARDGTLWKQLYSIRFPSSQVKRINMMKEEQRVKTNHAKSVDSSSNVPLNTSVVSESSLATVVPPLHAVAAAVNKRIAEDRARMSTPVTSNAVIHSLLTRTPGNITIDPSTQDWYTIFKQRIQLERDFQPIIFEFGSDITKCAFLKSSQSRTTPHVSSQIKVLYESYVARIPGIHDIHARRSESYAALVGEYPYKVHHAHDWKEYVFERGHCVDVTLIPELLSHGYKLMNVWSHRHPILFAEPPFQWSIVFKETLLKRMKQIFRTPGVVFVNSALLTMLSDSSCGSSAIVVHCDSETVWVSGIYQYRQLVLADFTSSLESPNRESNNDLIRRHPEIAQKIDRSYEKERDVLPKEQQIKSVSGSLLVSAIIDVYQRMHSLLMSHRRGDGDDDDGTTSSAADNSPFNRIIISGTSLKRTHAWDPDCIDQYNKNKNEFVFDSNYHSLVKVNEFPTDDMKSTADKENAILASTSASTSSSPASPLQCDLVLSLATSKPQYDIIRGGTVFGGLPQFHQYCINTFDLNFQHEYSSSWSMYSILWQPVEWLKAQFMYETIAEHFHWDESESAYIGNTSCSEEECDRLLDPKKYSTYYMHNEMPKRRLVWRRRIAGTQPRLMKDRRADPNRYINPKITVSPTLARELHQRSAFPLLPPSCAKWYEEQRTRRKSKQQSSNIDLYLTTDHLYSRVTHPLSLVRSKFARHECGKFMQQRKELKKPKRVVPKHLTPDQLMENMDAGECKQAETYVKE